MLFYPEKKHIVNKKTQLREKIIFMTGQKEGDDIAEAEAEEKEERKLFSNKRKPIYK